MSPDQGVMETPAQRWERLRSRLALTIACLALACLALVSFLLYRAETPSDRRILDEVERVRRQGHAIHTDQLFVKAELAQIRALLQRLLTPSPEEPMPPAVRDPHVPEQDP